MSAVAERKTLDIAPISTSRLSKVIELDSELTVLEQGEEPIAGLSVFRILHPLFGDKRICWNRMNLTEINAARDLFKNLIVEGLTPYRVGTDGKKTSEVMTEFDPAAEEVIFVPTSLVRAG